MFDAERKIRFVYPPLFFAGSLAWAFYLDPAKLTDVRNAWPWQQPSAEWTGALIALVGASGVLVFSGFVIGSMTVLMLRLAFASLRRPPYEAYLSLESAERIHSHLAIGRPFTKRDVLYLSAMLDHDVISPPMHAWLVRRWSMFYVHANSAMGLLMAWVLVKYFGFAIQLSWWGATILVFVVLSVLAFFNWKDTMGMLNFQASRLRSPSRFE